MTYVDTAGSSERGRMQLVLSSMMHHEAYVY